MVTVYIYYNYYNNLFIYLRKCVLQHLYPNKLSKCLQRDNKRLLPFDAE